MKINLVVSNCVELRVEGAEKLQFLTTNCYEEAIGCQKPPEQWLQTLSHTRDTKKTIDFIEKYLDECLLVIANKLLHQFGKDDLFWREVLYFYLRDLVDGAYTIFSQIEEVFDLSKHQLQIASRPEKTPLYGVSGTVQDAFYWGITDEGREYYAGEYFRTFYPGVFEEKAFKRKSFAPNSQDTRTNYKSITPRIKSYVKYFLNGNSRRLRVMVTNAQYDSFFGKKTFLRSLGRVSFHHSIPSLEKLYQEFYSYNYELRREIASPLTSSKDRFKHYLGRCLETSLPWSLAEGFERSFTYYNEFWMKFPKLEYLISENLYQHDALPRAVCASRGVEMITLPHFFPLEIYAPARLTHLMVQEKYISRGNPASSRLAIGSGTVFPYKIKGIKTQKTIDILYVTTDFYVYFQPLQQSADGCGYDVLKQFENFVVTFFDTLPTSLISKISLKKRPIPLLSSMQLDYRSEMKEVEPSLPAKTYMRVAKLVLIEGMSTALFESLASDIPTIAFWPADLYRFDPAFDLYFSELEEVGIVLHDPIFLAKQVTKVQGSPDSWWSSPDVRAARKRFLNLNLHTHQDFERVLLNLLKRK